MSEETCPVCGNRNAPTTQFCGSCGAYVGWETGDEPPSRPADTRAAPSALEAPREQRPAPRVEPHAPPSAPEGHAQVHRTSIHEKGIGSPSGADATPPVPAQQSSSTRSGDRPLRPGGDLEVQVEVAEAVVTPGGAPATVDVAIANTSSIVEAYLVTVVDPPSWLVVVPGAVRLLPGTDGGAKIVLSIPEDDLPPAGHTPLLVRVQGESDRAVRRQVPVGLVVGPVRGPVRMRLEPSILRANDSTMALFRIAIDNRHSNEPLRVSLSGRDPEQKARFWFSNPSPVVPPAGESTVRLRVDVPALPPGAQLNHVLTVLASDGRREFEATATLVQMTSPAVVDSPVLLGLSPSVVRERDAARVATLVTADNRLGHYPHYLTIGATDDENVVRFAVQPTELVVQPGQVASARVAMHAPRPERGQEVSRPFTISAWDGANLIQAKGTLVQSASDRRPLARALLTLLGAGVMAMGAFRLWTSDPARSGRGWDVSAVTRAIGADEGVLTDSVEGAGMQLGILNMLVNGATVVMACAVIALLGLIGSTGRLTRAAALLCLIFVVALLVAVSLGPSGAPALSGQVTWVVLGCIIAFIGGVLARRGRPATS